MRSLSTRSLTFVGALLALLHGPAGAQDSENVTLLGNYAFSSWHSDIWGYESGGTELAIVGGFDGTAFIDVTDPTDPTEVYFLPGAGTIWRDIKTYDTYAYVVGDDYDLGGNGLQIVDLSDPLDPTFEREITAQFDTAHNVWIDVPAGLLFTVGTGDFTYVYDVAANPANPPHVYTFSSFYIHDMMSQDGVAYTADIYGGNLVTHDMTALPGSWPVLDQVQTDGDFCHNVWVTEDNQYAYTTDEVSGGHLTVVDISDPSNISRVGSYLNPDDPTSIVHNVLVKGNFAYVAWYRAGLEIVDISNPTNPIRAGYYDTYPGGGSGFDGAWGVYPFAPSGNVYVSDINTGLYVFAFDATAGALEGTVTDLDSGDPLEGVVVSIPDADTEVTTDASGFYRVGLSAGAYDVTYSIFGYEDEMTSVEIEEVTTLVADVALTALPSGSLSGTVESSGGFVALPGATVAIEGTPLATVTDGSGGYSFDMVPVGSYTVVADAVGYAPLEIGVAVSTDGTVQNFNLEPATVADSFEGDSGWTVGAAGDDATTGIWERVNPRGTSSGGQPVQPEDDHTPDGTMCYVTGQGPPGGGIGDDDVDDGRTTLLSPLYDLTGLTEPVLVYHRWYSNNAGPSVNDTWRADISDDGGESWVDLENLTETRNFWEQMSFELEGMISPTDQVQIRFIAEDQGFGSIVEAGIDDLEIWAAGGVVAVPGGTGTAGLRPLVPVSNPFRSAAMLRFELDREAEVVLEIFDATGRRVRTLHDGFLAAGQHLTRWDGRDGSGHSLAPGIYLARLRTPDSQETVKLVRAR